jgi:hypothetical protein
MLPTTLPELDETLSFIYGDPWSGLGQCNVRLENGDPPTPDLDRVELIFENMLSVSLTVTSGANWEFTDPAAIYPTLTPGTYKWRVVLTDAADVPQTYLVGFVTVKDT